MPRGPMRVRWAIRSGRVEGCRTIAPGAPGVPPVAGRPAPRVAAALDEPSAALKEAQYLLRTPRRRPASRSRTRPDCPPTPPTSAPARCTTTASPPSTPPAAVPAPSSPPPTAAGSASASAWPTTSTAPASLSETGGSSTAVVPSTVVQPVGTVARLPDARRRGRHHRRRCDPVPAAHHRPLPVTRPRASPTASATSPRADRGPPDRLAPGQRRRIQAVLGSTRPTSTAPSPSAAPARSTGSPSTR